MKSKSLKKFNTKKDGFTLVETLVALLIFTVSILSVMSVLTSGISNTTYVKQKTTAGYLAQEGIEYIRNMRDTFAIYDASGAQTGWTSFVDYLLGASCDRADGCYFNNSGLDYNDPSQPMTRLIVTGCNGSCPNLKYDPQTGKYDYASVSGVDSGLSRKISITQIDANEIQISSTVYWQQGSGSYNITFTEHLFNWVE